MSTDTSNDLLEVAPPPRGGGRKRLILAGAAGAALLLGGAGIGYVAGGSGTDHAEKAPGAAATESAPTYVDVPPMTINLRTPGGAPRLLKLHVMLVPAASGGSSQDIEAKLPMLLDAFQPFVRELRPDDLAGSAAVFRVKEELLVRAGHVFGRGVIRDVLIQDMVQQ